MKTVDTEKLHRKVEAKRYASASKCKHFAKDKQPTPCLWHGSYCLHPTCTDPEESGQYTHCALVHEGRCDR